MRYSRPRSTLKFHLKVFIVLPVGVHVPHFDQISVKISVLGVLCPNRCTDEGEIWHGRGASSVPNVTPIGATCRPYGPKNFKIGL